MTRHHLILALACTPVASSLLAAAVPQYDHIVIVVEENHSYTQITNTYAASAPYINQTLIAQGASFTKFYGEEHPSEGNYLWMFSGDRFNIAFTDPCPVGPFNSPNLGTSLINSGYSFKGYSEDLPVIGSTVCTSGAYARKHNPWVNFSNVPNGSTVATSSNLRMTDFPTDYNQLPTVSFVIPNQDNDMHNGTNPATVATGDAWLQSRLDGYYQWAKTHNSLLILTFDESNGGSAGITDPATGSNHIVTVFAGAGIAPGNYAEGVGVNHVNMLRTLEDMYGLPHAGGQTTLATAAGLSNAGINDFFAQWKNDADGLWSDGSNWVGGVAPSGNSAVCNLLSAIGADRTITLGAARTINVCNIDNANAYTISGSGSLTFDAVVGGTAKLRVANGSHLISVPVVAARNLTLDVEYGAQVTLSNFDTTGVTLAKNGGGRVEADKLRALNASINEGTVGIIANGAAEKVSRVDLLLLAGGASPTATLDLRDNDLMITLGNAATVAAQIAKARHGGAWDRQGITSSTAASAAITSLGLLTGSEYLSLYGAGATFDDLAVANTDVLVKYTYTGDTDFNGLVDGADYARIDTTFNNEVATQSDIGGWFNGDLDYNGKVDGADYALIDAAFNAQSASLGPSGMAAVPEPAAAGMTLLLALSRVRRSRGQGQRQRRRRYI